jgi:hypothetical protein
VGMLWILFLLSLLVLLLFVLLYSVFFWSFMSQCCSPFKIYNFVELLRLKCLSSNYRRKWRVIIFLVYSVNWLQLFLSCRFWSINIAWTFITFLDDVAQHWVSLFFIISIIFRRSRKPVGILIVWILHVNFSSLRIENLYLRLSNILIHLLYRWLIPILLFLLLVRFFFTLRMRFFLFFRIKTNIWIFYSTII